MAKIKLSPDEFWPLWSIDEDGDDLVEVSDEQAERWARVMQDFAEVQDQMQEAIDRARKPR